MKRILSLLLCLILCLGMLPAAYAAETAEEIKEPAETNEHAFVPGYVEPEKDVQYPAPAASAQSDRAVPSAYSSRSKWVSPVKDQASNGLCWDFTACALMETNLLRNGYGTYDLSELHMGYAMSDHSDNSYGVSRAPYDGGNREIASAYFMRGMPLDSSGQALCVGGFVSESNDPYNPNQLPDRSTSETFSGKPKYVMPKDAIYLCGSKNNGDGIDETELKSIVQTYGAVGASMYWDDYCYDSSTTAFYLDWNPGGSNHSVTIVGWDDNYSRNNFSTTPGRDGAWLIKNSWGDWWGDDGYFWISYDDPIFPSYAWTVDGVIKYDNTKMQTYEYDYTPCDYWYIMEGYDALFARFFDASKTGAVSSVQVFLPMADSSVQVDVVPNVNKVDMDAYSFSSKASRNCHYAGWYTISLSSPVTVEKGARFAVIVRTDKTVGVDSDSSGINSSLRWSSSAGQWDDSYDEGWCIKALVSKSNLSAPTITSATGKTSSGKPTLKWSTVSGASKYAVYRANSSNGTYTKLYTTTKTSYTNTSAKAGYTYYYKVCAVDSNGTTGPASSSVGVHCRPVKPTITSATGKTSSGKPTLKWKAVDGAAKYVVYRANSSSGTYTKLYTTTKTSYTNTSAKTGYTYYYKVYAVDSKGYWSVASSSVGVRCRIAKPTITSATGKNSSGKPTLKWKAVSGAAKYVVYRADSSNGTYTKMYTTTSTSYTNTSAKVGYTYYYKVYAVDSKGYWSAASSAIGVHCRPAAPTFTSKTTSSGKPMLKWKAVTGASKYVIYRAGSSNGTYTKMYTTTSTSYTNTSAKAGYTYYYKVYAVDSKGYASAASAVAGIKATK